jgi:hypothetical protein
LTIHYPYTINNTMASWKGAFSLLLALIYLPAASLCLMERAGWFSYDDCCASDSQDASSSNSSGHMACCSLASATYKLDDSPAIKIAVTVAVPVLLVDVTPLVHEPDPAEIIPVSTSPPELPACWQFSFRAALPARAPSFVS